MGFRENLKAELAYSGMLVKELAELSGVNKFSIDNYLNKREQAPSVDAAVKIAQVLGVSVEYLVTGEEPAAHEPRTASPEMRLFLRAIEELHKENRETLMDIIEVFKKRQSVARSNMPVQT